MCVCVRVYVCVRVCDVVYSYFSDDRQYCLLLFVCVCVCVCLKRKEKIE